MREHSKQGWSVPKQGKHDSQTQEIQAQSVKDMCKFHLDTINKSSVKRRTIYTWYILNYAQTKIKYQSTHGEYSDKYNDKSKIQWSQLGQATGSTAWNYLNAKHIHLC